MDGKISWEHGYTWRSTIQFKYEEWDVPMVLLEKSQWSRFNGIYFVSFEFIKMWEISKFKRFLSLQIQINYKNEVLEGKINWECGHTCKTYLNLQKLDIECKV